MLIHFVCNVVFLIGFWFMCCDVKVKKLKRELFKEDLVPELSRAVKQRMIDEILHRLHHLDAKSNVSAVRGGCCVIFYEFTYVQA